MRYGRSLSWYSSGNSSALSESTLSTVDRPPKSPPPAPARARIARGFICTVSTFWLPIAACRDRPARFFGAVLRFAADFFFPLFALNFAFAETLLLLAARFLPLFLFFFFIFRTPSRRRVIRKSSKSL